jgi:hypothetical protein
MNNSKAILLSLQILCSIFSCKNRCPSEITKEIEGNYKFIYPTGQIEVISIKNDFTYSQEIYLSEKSYTARDTLYKNSGIWSFKDLKMEFDHWLVFCKFRNPNNVLDKPYIATMLGVSWCAPEAEKHKGFIIIHYESGYVFEFVK